MVLDEISKKITLDSGQVIKLTLSEPNGNGGYDSVTISSTLHEKCPYCEKIDCEIDCFKEDIDTRNFMLRQNLGMVKWNAAIDLLESLVMAHAGSGVDIFSSAYGIGLHSALEAFGNNVE